MLLHAANGSQEPNLYALLSQPMASPHDLQLLQILLTNVQEQLSKDLTNSTGLPEASA